MQGRILAAVLVVSGGTVLAPPAARAADAPLCLGRPATVVLTDSDDTYVDTQGVDSVIWAGAGNDTIDAGGGNDTVCGGDGDDDIQGGA